MIAKLRHSTPGVTLISPPPHHDIYSIEDLAQLIYDLKQINPTCARLREAGVGCRHRHHCRWRRQGACRRHPGRGQCRRHRRIAPDQRSNMPEPRGKWGYPKCEPGADAEWPAPQREACAPMAASRPGATSSSPRSWAPKSSASARCRLVAMGCIMVRQCHSNTCPVGVCVQDERLRAKFTGTPEKVINLMTFIAEEVREILAQPGLPQPRRESSAAPICCARSAAGRASRRSRPQPDPRQGRRRRRPARSTSTAGATRSRQPRRADPQGRAPRVRPAVRRCS
jgi:glutamate synthase (NADPH/NADH) large chain